MHNSVWWWSNRVLSQGLKLLSSGATRLQATCSWLPFGGVLYCFSNCNTVAGICVIYSYLCTSGRNERFCDCHIAYLLFKLIPVLLAQLSVLSPCVHILSIINSWSGKAWKTTAFLQTRDSQMKWGEQSFLRRHYRVLVPYS